MIIKYRPTGVTAFKSLNFESQSVELWDIIQRIVKENKMDQTPFEFELVMYDAKTGTEISNYRQEFTTEVELEYKKTKPRVGMSSYQSIVKNPNLLKVKLSAIEIPTQKVETEEEKIQNTINGVYQPQFNKIEALFNPNKMKVRTIPPVNAIPPKSYICKKCKKPGHYVYRCPNGADSADAQFSHVKLVGIPLKNLMIIDDPSTVTVELRRHIGQLQDGRYAIQKSKVEDFEKDITNTTSITQNTSIDMLKVPEELKCSICKKLLREAVRTFCCGKLVCDECARQDIVNHNGKCSLCHNNGNNEKLIGDSQVRKKVNEYIKSEMSKINEEEKKNGVKLFENEDEIPIGERVEGGVDNIIPLNNNNSKDNNNNNNKEEDEEEDDDAIDSEIDEIIKNENNNKEDEPNNGKKTISLDDLIFGSKSVCGYCNSQDHSLDECPIKQKEMNNSNSNLAMTRNSIPFLLAPPPQSPYSKYERSSKRNRSRSRSRHSSHTRHYHHHHSHSRNISSNVSDNKKEEIKKDDHHHHRHEYEERERERIKEKEINKEREKEKEREMEREWEKEKEREREREREKEKEKEREREKEKERNKERERERAKERNKERERIKDRERERERKERNKEGKERETEKEREKDSHRDSLKRKHESNDDVHHHNHKRRESEENRNYGNNKLKEYISKGDTSKSSDSKKPPISTKVLRELRNK